MKLTSKGQVTIPQRWRERFGIHPKTEVTFEPLDDGVLIKPARDERVRRFKKALKRARGSADKGLSTAEIMNLTRGED